MNQPAIPTLIRDVLRARGFTGEVTADSTFAELAICPVDRVCIAEEVLERFGFEPSDVEYESWDSCADVIAAVEKGRVGA